jgi:hypothetical protein
MDTHERDVHPSCMLVFEDGMMECHCVLGIVVVSSESLEQKTGVLRRESKRSREMKPAEAVQVGDAK